MEFSKLGIRKEYSYIEYISVLRLCFKNKFETKFKMKIFLKI